MTNVETDTKTLTDSDSDTKLTAGMTLAFASPILRFTLPGAVALNRKLVAEAQALRAADPGIQRSNRQGWHSRTDLMARTEPGLTELRGFIEKVMQAATRTIAPGFETGRHRLVADGWININPQHGYNVPHRHNGFIWSGTYYVTVPEGAEGSRSGNIEFLSPLMVPRDFGLLGAECYNEKITMRPKAGDLVLFPSYLTHWVYPNDADEERISIAFNGAYVPR